MRLPENFEKKMRDLLKEDFDDYIACYEEPRYYGLRVNTNKISVEEFKKICPFEIEPIPWIENGFYYDGENVTPSKHPYYFAGLYYLQEPSAMTPANRLPVEPGDKVLDVCAAPGGKATELGAKLQGEGVLAANDISNSRAKGLLKNIEVFGIGNVLVLSEEPGKMESYFTEYFDKILIDAPCSGEGMFRKDKKMVSAWEEHGPDFFCNIQKSIILQAARMLKQGGMMLYSTCTFAPEEDEQAIGRFLEAHPEFTLEETPDYPGLSHGVPAWGAGVTDGIEKTVRIWPHRTEGEGHYAALLRKTGEPESVKRKYPASMKDKKLLAVYEDFCKEIFIEPKKWTADSTMTMFGDQLYRTPEEMVDFKGLRVLRPGLQMGEFKKNRFEPSHALALALHPSEVKQNVNLSADAPETAAYLRGETIQLSEEDAGKGWCLVSVDGYSLGWGKKSGGTLKNHYPKGLRKQY